MPFDALNSLAISFEPQSCIIAEGKTGGTVDGDAIVFVWRNQPGKARTPGYRGGLAADALRQTTASADYVRVAVDQNLAKSGSKNALGKGHADGVSDPLPRRASCGLDSVRLLGFGMSGRK